MLVNRWAIIRDTQPDHSRFEVPELAQNLDPHKLAVSFPNENIIPITMGHATFAPIVQTAEAVDTSLQTFYVQQLAAHRANLEVIYGLEDTEPGVDGVQDMTRVPIIFQYLAENFVMKVNHSFNGYLVLEPRAQPLPLQRTPLNFQTAATDTTRLQATLTNPSTCALLELQLNIRFPLITALGRANGLMLQVSDGNQIVKSGGLVTLEPGRPFNVFMYLGQPEDFQYAFRPAREGEPTVFFDRLEIETTPSTLFDILPNVLELTQLNCIH